MNLASEAIWRKPFGHCVGIEKRAIDALRRGFDDTVKSNGMVGHDGLSKAEDDPPRIRRSEVGRIDSASVAVTIAPVKPSIYFVDVDRPETWTRYRNGLCDHCVANCCTMPVEVRLPDLVRLALVDPFEAEHEAPKQIAKRLSKAGLIDPSISSARSTRWRAAPVAIAAFWMRARGAARSTNSGPTPAASIHR